MSTVEITFLGTTAGIPTRQRSHPAIHFNYKSGKEFCYLFDCGEGTQRQMLLAGLNFMKISEIFITHWHSDHYLGLPGLIDTMDFEGRTQPLVIHSTEPQRVKKMLDVDYNAPSFEVVCKRVSVKHDLVTTLLDKDDFMIVSTPVQHVIPSVAYALIGKDRIKIDKIKLKEKGLPFEGKIYGEIKEKGEVVFKGRVINLKEICSVRKGKKIVYSGDTKICDNLIKIAQNADLLIQDCTYFDEADFKEYEHASIGDIIKLLEKIKIKKVILTHISRRYKNSDGLKEKIKDFPNLEVAADFMRVTV